MEKLIVILITTFSLFVNQATYSQGTHTSSNKALKYYNDGVSAYDFLDFPRAERCFRDAIATDNNFFEAYLMLGELMLKQKKYAESAAAYQRAVSIDSLFFKPVYFSLAKAEMMSSDFSRAIIHFNVYLSQPGMQEKNRTLAAKMLKNCEFSINAVKNPVPFNPVSLGPEINTANDEYWPSITADGQTLMFTKQLTQSGENTSYGLFQEDFYISSYTDDRWQKAEYAGWPLNSRQNEGAQTLASNGISMFFTACDRNGGVGSCDIYFSSVADGRWAEPSNLGPPVNSTYWESQPSISSDGRKLFFSSSRPGGFGGKDIWFSVLSNNNKWSVPKNAGSSINTNGDEMSPFIHFDGKTLYFSSDGRVGIGGFDIYISRMITDSTWSEPQNLGYPINTLSDDMGLVIESSGQMAYFSSVRDQKNGKDIFSFNLYESIRPEPVAYLKGKVYDRETGKLLKADYELVNLSSGEINVKNSTDEIGNFLVCLPSGYNYGINVSKSGYLFYSENFMFEGDHSVMKPFIKKISLSPVKVGEKMLLSNIFYEIDSWQLKKESLSELNNLIRLLTENKGLILEIGGYTDSTGTAEYNKQLSEKRAISVVKYLVDKGVSQDRLKSVGYGNSSPIGDNVTEEGRKLNRRTEAKVIDKK